jgi:homocitrate synthase NifV
MRRRRPIALRDSTLREGLDTPGVRFSPVESVRIARALAGAGVREVEVVAPARVADGLALARRLRDAGIQVRTSGLVYANRPQAGAEVEAAAAGVDRVDLLMPLSPKRPPASPAAKLTVLLDVLARAPRGRRTVGVGFPHATQAAAGLVRDIALAAVQAGAARVTVYDTNGSADPFAVRDLVADLTRRLAVPVFFHGHDDLGLATANALGAVLGGARGLDVTVNGLGDRAGNARLEQVVMALELRGWPTGVDRARLRALSRLVARLSGVPVSRLAPVVGDLVFAHRSPGHLPVPSEFEAFAPGVVGAVRRMERTRSVR